MATKNKSVSKKRTTKGPKGGAPKMAKSAAKKKRAGKEAAATKKPKE